MFSFIYLIQIRVQRFIYIHPGSTAPVHNPPNTGFCMSKPKGLQRRLPPLLVTSPSGHQLGPNLSTSRYHSNCCLDNRPLSPGPGCYLDASASRASGGNVRNLRTPQRQAGAGRPLTESPTGTYQRVSDYLKKHDDFLEEYVLENVSLDLLQQWVIRKTRRKREEEGNENDSTNKDPNLSRIKFCVPADKREMLQELMSSLFVHLDKRHVFSELANTVSTAIGADGWSLHMYDADFKELSSFRITDNNVERFLLEGTLAEYVMKTKKAVRCKSQSKDNRFPSGISTLIEEPVNVLCHPVLQPDGELSGVLEFYKKEPDSEFQEEDEEIVNSYLVWGGTALHYAELYASMMKQRELNKFLMTVVKSIFQDMVSMDTVIIKIMMFARKLVSADRASLFLLDGRTGELYARIFDVNETDGDTKKESDIAPQEIRFPMGTGIAGYVAMTGESLNIPDAYNDPRFNRSVDQQTGYNTKNLLCMPIFIRKFVIGVVQMVNKSSGPFTKSDEEAFSTFAIYCGLALHHAKLYDKIRKSEQKHKLALEILSYHSTCTDAEIASIQAVQLPMDPKNLEDFRFYSDSLNSDEKVMASIHMLSNLPTVENCSKIDPDSLARFTLTVRKNYRRVPYHNWSHGFCVANSVYAILRSTAAFRPLEGLALYVSCLCHDLDHRGKTNQFLVAAASPLAAIYTTSVLEHHHFNMTVSILQQDGHNIFRNLSSADYKKVLSNIKHCIIATDLALFFPNKARLSEIVKENRFDWSDHEHRLLLQTLIMTACDLCGSTKNWTQQEEIVKVIFQEFYDQGDAEKSQGRQPIPIMDRTKVDEQPDSQVGFLKGICIPCYELLYNLIPETKPMLDGCRENLEHWESLTHKNDSEKNSSSDDMDSKDTNQEE
ncbi:hypothetical protein JTE90_003687 [Oedothorax gibbosus]|uniref:Phosphodiesterase n=1 Tax=Oedothorax gibbosus TaxID=931172 RepID=A0AAV6VRK6_9ARAC|nr:hypothetical protein JTE90_003687 [Oedothorax gibbosus]